MPVIPVQDSTTGKIAIPFQANIGAILPAVSQLSLGGIPIQGQPLQLYVLDTRQQFGIQDAQPLKTLNISIYSFAQAVNSALGDFIIWIPDTNMVYTFGQNNAVQSAAATQRSRIAAQLPIVTAAGSKIYFYAQQDATGHCNTYISGFVTNYDDAHFVEANQYQS